MNEFNVMYIAEKSGKRENLEENIYLVSLPTLISTFFGMIKPKCALKRQFVGPVCGHTCVPGVMMENLI